MGNVQRDLKGDSAVIQDFEKIYKSAYSHGLESIYALEHVDIRSVRRLQKPNASEVTEQKVVQVFDSQTSQQFEFDFGPEYRHWISPFFLEEPIHVLELSKFAEKNLEDHGKFLLSDLLDGDIGQLLFLKGMGQGHFDEIKNKLKLYIGGRPTDKAFSIDFCGWLRSLCKHCKNRKKIFVFMELYQLGELFTVKPADSMEIRRLSVEKRSQWVQEMLEECLSPINKKNIDVQMNHVFNAFIKPWMNGRLGIATQSEIQERFEKVSDDPSIAAKALQFFSEVFYDNAFPINLQCHQVEPEVYCADARTADCYLRIIKLARSYFYKKEVVYDYTQFVNLIAREAALSWNTFTDGFIEKVLQTSNKFKVRKNKKGILEISQCLTFDCDQIHP